MWPVPKSLNGGMKKTHLQYITSTSYEYSNNLNHLKKEFIDTICIIYIRISILKIN